MQAWLSYLAKLLGRQLQADDYIFPPIASTGMLKFGEPASRSGVENLLDEVVGASGLMRSRQGKFTTHCFRRGGAQYRFMWADKKWSLKAVKWWGGCHELGTSPYFHFPFSFPFLFFFVLRNSGCVRRASRIAARLASHSARLRTRGLRSLPYPGAARSRVSFHVSPGVAKHHLVCAPRLEYLSRAFAPRDIRLS